MWPALPHHCVHTQAARALVANPHVHLEPYLQQLIPAVMTCLVAKRLGSGPTEDHWALRDSAASLLSLVCTRYGEACPNVQPRICRTLLSALRDDARALTTHYGAPCWLLKGCSYCYRLHKLASTASACTFWQCAKRPTMILLDYNVGRLYSLSGASLQLFNPYDNLVYVVSVVVRLLCTCPASI